MKSPIPYLTLALAATLLSATLVPAPLSAEELSARVVGRDGELFTLRAGTYGELFAGGTEVPTSQRVLGLERTDAYGATTRLLLPGSEGPAVEENPVVAFDDEAGSVMMVWQIRHADGRLSLRYGAWDGSWSTMSDLLMAGEPAMFDAPPALAISRDAIPVRASERKIIVVRRTVINVAWRDASVKLSPIVFVEGMPIGWNETVNLSAALATQVPALAAPAAGAVYQTLSLRTEPARRSVVVTFADAATGQIAEVEHRFRPMDIAMVGPDVRNRIFRLADLYKPETMNAIDSQGDRPIVHLGSHGLGKDEMTALAEGIRGHIIGIGAQSNAPCSADGSYEGTMVQIGIFPMEGLPGAENGELYLALVGTNSDEMTSLPAGIRGHIIGIGQQSNACNPDGSDLGEVVYVGSGGEILVVDPTGQPLAVDQGALVGDNGNADAMIATSSLWLRSSAPLPPSAGASTYVFTGRATTNFLVAWKDTNAFHYQLTNQDGWSDVFQLPLADLGDEQALTILSQRLR